MKTCLLASGLGLLAISAAAPADARAWRPLMIEQVEVRHGDLDLATAAGAGAMLARLTGAASQACGGKPSAGQSDPLGPSKQRAYRLCKVGAVDAATLRLDAELVRTMWLESGEAIRFGETARRTRAHLLRQADVAALARPAGKN
jgi:UrcA family protein